MKKPNGRFFKKKKEGICETAEEDGIITCLMRDIFL